MAMLSAVLTAILKLVVCVLCMVLGVFTGKKLRSIKNKKTGK